MNQKDKAIRRNQVFGAYHTPGSYLPRPRNAIFIRPENSKAHEMKKLEICWKLRRDGKEFLTEAQDKDTKRIRDVVSEDGTIYEIINTHGDVNEKGVTAVLCED